MQILHVAPITRSITTEALTYFSAKPVNIGSLITVPLRKQQVKALVIDSTPVTNLKIQLRGADYQIRNIIDVHDEQIFSPAYLHTCNQLKNFYATNTGILINLISPRFIINNIEQCNRPLDNKSKNAQYQKYILQRNTAERYDYYKTLLREKLLRKESIHIICPTQHEVTALFQYLAKNNESSLQLLHSKITKKKLTNIFTTLQNSETPSCVISTPGFIDTYQHNKSTIIIENESSEHYRSIAKPYIDMRIFIDIYCKYRSLKCIFAASIIRPELWYLTQKKEIEIIEPFNKKIFKKDDIFLLNLHQRQPGKQNDTERFDELTKSTNFSVLDRKSITDIRRTIDDKKNVFIYSHKKSLAPTIICRHCGNMARSSESGFPYSLYIKQNQNTKNEERVFVCRNTGEKIPAFDICQFCQGHHLIPFGIGTEKIYQEISELFPNVQTYIIDGNHNTTQKKLREITTEYENTQMPTIIIGTQKALPFISRTDLGIISSLDSYFSRMSYSIQMQCLHLIKEISEKSKHVIIQSRNIIESVLPVLQHGLYPEFIESELQEREDYSYPPFSTVIVIKKTIAREYLKKQYNQLNRLLGTFDPQILIQPGKKKGHLELVTIFQLKISQWSTEYQNESLLQMLGSLDRTYEIYINPKDLQ